MVELLPSILSADFAHLADQVAAAERGGGAAIHVDIMDGHFVPNITIGPPVVQSLRKATSLPLDCHLMIENANEFIPAFADAGGRQGAVVFFSASGNTGTQLGSVLVYGIGTGPQIAFGPGVATAIDPTVNGIALLYPFGMAVDGAGDLFITDPNNNRVVEVPAGGGPAIAVDPTVNGNSLDHPYGVAVDGSGDLFIADSYNSRVVEVPAGGGAAIAIDPTANGESLGEPDDVAVDGVGDLFISDGLRVVEVPAGGGPAIAIRPMAGGKPLAGGSWALALDDLGDLFVSDSYAGRVLEIPAGGGATIAIAPTVNGRGLVNISGVAVDGAGDLFIADNTDNLVVEVPAGGGAAIIIDPTVGGRSLFTPYGVTVDGAGDLFIADSNNNRVVEVQHSQPPTLNFPTTTDVGSTDTTDGTQTAQIQNIGNQALNLTGLSYPADFPLALGDASACTSSISLSAGQECDVPVEFAPLNSGALSENVTLTDNNLNGSGAQQSIAVTGTAAAKLLVTCPATNSGTPDVYFSSGPETVAGGVQPYTFYVGSGTLPNGLNLNTSTGAVTGTPASSGSFTVSLKDADSVVAKTSCGFSIGAPTLIITWSTPSPITYGTALSATQLNASKNVAGSFAYNPTAGTVLQAGMQKLTATFTPTDTKDYSVTKAQVSLQVNQATPVLSWNPALLQIDSKLGEAQLNATASVPGKFVYTPASGTKITTTTETLTVVFTPTDTTDYTAANIAVPLQVGLVSVSPPTLKFGTVYLGSVTYKDVTVTNLAPVPVTISNPSIASNPGDSKEFAAANLCPKSLPAHKDCTIKVAFVAGSDYIQQSAMLNLKDNSPGSPQTISLTALTIDPKAALSATSLNYGRQKKEASSAAKPVTLTNTGATPLIIGSISVAGSDPNDFKQTNICPSSLGAGYSCIIDVTFKPKAKGSRSAKLVIKNNAQNSPQSVSLSGTGD